ncbi:MAG: hypothetical protein GWN41_13485 [Phycisphaerae bacterium]|nr:hypothetical protein [Phycisphaerae bacterium]
MKPIVYSLRSRYLLESSKDFLYNAQLVENRTSGGNIQEDAQNTTCTVFLSAHYNDRLPRRTATNDYNSTSTSQWQP